MEHRFLSVLVALTGTLLHPTTVLIEASGDVNREHHERTMRWDRWTEWSQCTAKCGTGVSVRSRVCRSMVDGSTVDGCHGISKETKLCTANPCTTDEAVEACRDLDLEVFSGRRYRWEPYIHPNNKCELACRAVGYGFYKGLKKSKKDGSPCDTDERYVCVNGTCKTYGCDKIIDSNASIDMCGVCKGDNSTCRIVSKIYTDDSHKSGYSTITTIPAGVRHINITELKPSRNYLALNEVGGSFRLNTDWRLSRRGNHSGSGTRFVYGEHLDTWCPGECITAEGPTTSPIELIVLFYTQNEGVAISYSVPIDTADELNLGQEAEGVRDVEDSIRHHRRHQHKRPIHSHDFTFMKSQSYRDRITNGNGNHYDHRSDIAEGRSNVRSPIIVEDAFENDPYATNANKSNTSALFKSNPTDGLLGPVIKEGNYNTVNLSNNVKIAPHGETNGSEYGKIESTTHATKELLPEDMYSRDNVIGSPYSWRMAGYSECSVTCGEGKRTSLLQCIVTSKNKAVDDSYCRNLIKPRDEVLSCTLGVCAASWRTDPWGKCNVTCGQGYRVRNVVCLSSGGATLDDRECKSLKPETSETCDMGSCTTGWFFTEWEKTCPFECGNGIQTRKVHCIGKVKNTAGAGGVSDSCSLQGMPSSERTCQVDKPCHTGGTWFTGPWGQCNATCGEAYQMRTVVCVRRREDGSPSSVVTDNHCKSEDKPPTYTSCDVEPCQPEWYMTEWSVCSVTCGAGQKTRSTRCLNTNFASSVGCSPSSKPVETEGCQMDRQCTSTEEGALVKEDKDCSDTFGRCDMVIRANLCRYSYYAKICCKSCSEAAKY